MQHATKSGRLGPHSARSTAASTQSARAKAVYLRKLETNTRLTRNLPEKRAAEAATKHLALTRNLLSAAMTKVGGVRQGWGRIRSKFGHTWRKMASLPADSLRLLPDNSRATPRVFVPSTLRASAKRVRADLGRSICENDLGITLLKGVVGEQCWHNFSGGPCAGKSSSCNGRVLRRLRRRRRPPPPSPAACSL